MDLFQSPRHDALMAIIKYQIDYINKLDKTNHIFSTNEIMLQREKIEFVNCNIHWLRWEENNIFGARYFRSSFDSSNCSSMDVLQYLDSIITSLGEIVHQLITGEIKRLATENSHGVAYY